MVSTDASNRPAIRKNSYANIDSVLSVPNLIAVQLESFEWLKGEGLKTLFDEISPI